jgi:hypothetical protein
MSKFGSIAHENNSIKDEKAPTKKDYPDHISDGTHKTKMSKKSQKSVKSAKSDRSNQK